MIIIVCDGGVRKGNPGPMYCSWICHGTLSDGSEIGDGEPVRIETERMGTNNEAEYLALLSALRGFVEVLKQRGFKPDTEQITIYSDSQLVVNQVAGIWRISPKFRWSVGAIHNLLALFDSWTLEWQPRELSVEWLGH